MAKDTKTHGGKARRQYARVPIRSVKGHRHGKHHDLIDGILQELEALSEGSAMKIPLAPAISIPMANLRSAVHRGAKSRGWKVETTSDEENLYIWKGNSIPSRRQ